MANLKSIWTNGVGDGDPTDTNNWSNGLDDRYLILDPEVSNDSMIGADLTFVAPIHGFTVLEGFTGDIGSVGDPLITTVQAAPDSTDTWKGFVLRGSGDVFIQVTTLAPSDFYIDAPWSGQQIIIYGDPRNIFIRSGNVTLASTAGFPSGGVVALVGAGARLSATTLTPGGPDDIILTAGVVNWTHALPTHATPRYNIYQSGGEFNMSGLIRTNNTVFVGTSATFNYSPPTDPAAETPVFYVDGTLDLTGSNYEVVFGGLVRGPNSRVLGTPQNALYDGTNLNIDMTQDYP